MGAINHFFTKKPYESISFKKLVAEFAINQASTERTGRDILKSLSELKIIKINGDEITKS